jgi:putative transposase
MPARNAIKTYVKNGYYHIYNRGVEKRRIFLDKQDYKVFLSYLKEYLLPKDIIKLQDQLNNLKTYYKEKDKITRLLRMNNFYDEIELLAFCLMPNHFHLLIKQNEKDSIDKFMNSLCTRYTMYFNKKYQRVGPLFQGVYKAVLVESEAYLLYLTRYIHSQAISFKRSRPSTLDYYLGKQILEWVNKDLILSYFSKSNPNLTYESFIYSSDTNYLDNITKLLID